MDSVTETLELCRRITTGYRPALRNSPVADCTRRFELLPCAMPPSVAIRHNEPACPNCRTTSAPFRMSAS